MKVSTDDLKQLVREVLEERKQSEKTEKLNENTLRNVIRKLVIETLQEEAKDKMAAVPPVPPGSEEPDAPSSAAATQQQDATAATVGLGQRLGAITRQAGQRQVTREAKQLEVMVRKAVRRALEKNS